MQKGVYYFSYYGDRTTRCLDGLQDANARMWKPFVPFAVNMGMYEGKPQVITWTATAP